MLLVLTTVVLTVFGSILGMTVGLHILLVLLSGITGS